MRIDRGRAAAGLLLLAGLLAAAALRPLSPALVEYPPSALLRVGPADRILILAPHPDDETLCCAGVIQQAARHGARVGIVWLTSGDAFTFAAVLFERALWPGPEDMRRFGRARMQEGRGAARVLGVAQTDQFFLGYPDGGLSALQGANFEVPYRSHHTGLGAVNYPGTLATGSDYEGRNLERQLERLITDWKPTFVLAPSVLDEHPDHRATGEFALRALTALHELARLRCWIVHGGAFWPSPRGWHPAAALQPPQAAAALAWESVPLDEAARAQKLRALEAHRSQMFGLERRFLIAFVRRNELFAPVAAPP